MRFSSVLAAIHGAMRASGSLFPRYDGDVEAVRRHAVAYYVADRKNRGPDNSWYADTTAGQRDHLIAIRTGAPAPTYERTRVLYLVHWAHFLWQARSDSPSPFKAAAFTLLRLLIPLIEQYDYVLSEDLKRWGQHLDKEGAYAKDNPFFFGQLHENDNQRLDLHLKSLLATKEFRWYLGETMRKSLRVFTARQEQTKLGRCGQKHSPKLACSLCEPIKWARSCTTLIVPDTHHRSERAVLEIVQPRYFADTPNRWTLELRHWLSCRQPSEGVVLLKEDTRRGNRLLVNFKQLIMDALQHERDTPILGAVDRRIVDEAYMEKFAIALRQGFAERTKNQYVVTKGYNLEESVNKAGWLWYPDQVSFYELYSERALLRKMDAGLSMARVQHLQRINAPVKPIIRKLPRIGHADFMDSKGITHVIDVLRRRPRLPTETERLTDARVNYYSLPYTLAANERNDKQRRHVSLVIGGSLFWLLRGVHKHASLVDPEGKAPLYPLANEFSEWVLVQETKLDDAGFRKLLRKDVYGQRVAAKLRGESVHIGAYEPIEDEAIQAALRARKDKGSLSLDEWRELLLKLPGRTKPSVLRRIQAMGFDYALIHGWGPYVRSHLCFNISMIRRKAWMKKGVTL